LHPTKSVLEDKLLLVENHFIRGINVREKVFIPHIRCSGTTAGLSVHTLVYPDGTPILLLSAESMEEL